MPTRVYTIKIQILKYLLRLKLTSNVKKPSLTANRILICQKLKQTLYNTDTGFERSFIFTFEILNGKLILIKTKFSNAILPFLSQIILPKFLDLLFHLRLGHFSFENFLLPDP